MPEDLLLGVRLADALDHRVVVPRIRQDQTVRHQPGERGDACLVRDIPGGENESGFLAVKVSKLALKLDEGMIVARDVTGAAGAGAHAGRGLDHGANHLGVLTHAEVIVRAPDHDVPGAFGRMPDGMGITAGDPLQVGKHTIPTLGPQLCQGIGKIHLVVAVSSLSDNSWRYFPAGPCASFFRRHWPALKPWLDRLESFLSRSVPGRLSRPYSGDRLPRH